ncbi:DNA-binding GntR family transcriptional regulator [Azospirillum agricola]|uniref:GntR family transcriptional regulator n=1 Tax=Azospirillum agricola TaxID=1720247 RepID=UPI001AEACC0C|nr:GntR family transcriptional regulator [Azospirillum agricola]MBP2231698.1 DNA-binding GntR family transcriptional regulator [Azospirillum agricola]
MPDSIDPALPERFPGRTRKRAGTDLLAADVHARLRTRILTFEIQPGSRLVEDEISASLGVGRTPVREALLRLQGEGLVSRRKGWVVESTDADCIDRVFESRVAIEGYATRLATLRASSADICDLMALVEEMDGFDTMSRAALNQLNRAFHERIVTLSGNPFFVEMHERTQFHYWNMRLPVLFTREQAVMTNEQHRLILGALSSGDPDDAERHARAHVATTHRIVRDALDG